MKITKQPDNHDFIKMLPAGLVGECAVCHCTVETEGNEVEGRWFSQESKNDGRKIEGWEAPCPIFGCKRYGKPTWIELHEKY